MDSLLFLLIFLVFLPSVPANICANIGRVHYSNVLRIKCDALLYRSINYDSNCYFALSEVQEKEIASESCSSILFGAKVATTAPNYVWDAMFLKKSDFHQSSSSGAKKTLCFYENPYKCSKGDNFVVSSQCTIKASEKLNYQDAEAFCAKESGSLPSIENGMGNRVVVEAIGQTPSWISLSRSDNKWIGKTSYSNFMACISKPSAIILLAKDPKMCSSNVAGVINSSPESTAYWTFVDQNEKLSFICVVEAESPYWKPQPKKPKPTIKCEPLHKRNAKTEECEWTGPSDACAQLLTPRNETMFITIPNYPTVTGTVMTTPFNAQFNDKVSKAIVRRGCSLTLFIYPDLHEVRSENRVLKGAEYGVHHVDTDATGTVSNPENGATRAQCMCDPGTTNPARNKKTKKCIEYHKWNENTGKCEWTLADNICGVVTNNQGRTLELSMWNWPILKRFDTIPRPLANLSEFDRKLSSITVRNGCAATLFNTGYLTEPPSMPTSGYGTYALTKGMGDRMLCECLANDYDAERIVLPTPKRPKCIESHEYNEITKQCEWTGPAIGCVYVTTDQKTTFYLSILFFPQKIAAETTFPGGFDVDIQRPLSDLNKNVVKATVRRGCMATFYSNTHNNAHQHNNENKILENVEYGEYTMPTQNTGIAECGSNPHNALSRVKCMCDPARALHKRAKATFKCQPNHRYDEATGQCEWTGEKNVCGEIVNSQGQKMKMIIPNWPQRKHYDVNLAKAGLTQFLNKISFVSVRQRCFLTIMADGVMWNKPALETVGYGTYTPTGNKGERVICECMYDPQKEDIDEYTSKPVTDAKPPVCVDEHAYNEDTGRCEWTGPLNSCARIRSFYNDTLYINIPIWPLRASQDIAFYYYLDYGFPQFSDTTTEVVVRQGCTLSMFLHPAFKERHNEARMLKSVEYGKYDVACDLTGTVEAADFYNGASRIQCMCDVFRTNVYSLPKTQTEPCIKNHKWNPGTKRCDWELDESICGEFGDAQGNKEIMKIPNWPLNKRYDMILYLNARLAKFEKKVTTITVRRGCVVAIQSGWDFADPAVLWGKSYGTYPVPEGQSTKIMCECIADDSNEESKAKYEVRIPIAPKCALNHKYSEKTKQCEWTGPAEACVELVHLDGRRTFVGIPGFPNSIYKENRLPSDVDVYGKPLRDYNDYTIQATIRRGCMCTFFLLDHANVRDTENRMFANIEYGDYTVYARYTGTSEVGNPDNGLTRVTCLCHPGLALHQKSPKSVPCLDGHKYDETTGQCEWNGPKNFCGTLTDKRGITLDLIIPNWPLQKVLDVNLNRAKNSTLNPFNLNVVSMTVRQRCFMTIYNKGNLWDEKTFPPSGYGKYKYTHPAGAGRVVCECMY